MQLMQAHYYLKFVRQELSVLVKKNAIELMHLHNT